MSVTETKQAPSRNMRVTVSGTVSTELDQVISGIPWGEAFDYGSGVDAVTGPHASAASLHTRKSTARLV